MSDEIVILITASSQDEASKIARTLVEERLAACVNVLAGVHSFFTWEGRIQEASEALMVCKSRLPMMDRIIARVSAIHSYTVPEIIALRVIAGLPEYLHWVGESTKDAEKH